MPPKLFDPQVELKKLYTPPSESRGEDNGQVTIIGGSSLFHGAPILSLRAASRIVDMVFFSSPEKSLEKITDYIKSELSSFVWVPYEEIEHYIEKSDAILIGPGFLRYKDEKNRNLDDCDEACQLTRDITKKLLQKYPHKKWVIDAGSLQTMKVEWIPKNAILTPNKKEFTMLFGDMNGEQASKKYNCIIVQKGPSTFVFSPNEIVEIKGGNAGLTKGGTGDVLAGLTAALLAKNDCMLAATVASYVIKKAADDLYKRVGVYYNADDLTNEIPRVLYSPQKMQ